MVHKTVDTVDPPISRPAIVPLTRSEVRNTVAQDDTGCYVPSTHVPSRQRHKCFALENCVQKNKNQDGYDLPPHRYGYRNPDRAGDETRYDDGILEVMGLFSSFHIAQLQIGLATPLRLGQASTVKITLHGGNAPMQVDGEPWEQHPASITITHRGCAAMRALGEAGLRGSSIGNSSL
ncbi:diacylglycerol kinase [Plakobranchus ocellatus]|uniref:Diacylglycerol kinase n=1 Tax=Plakobranchus ocellatus TaxID=259542 RepID=A0AAV4B096_9GAST|nr:diacylglycerol kinase [Plakobranchus ocellatus]